MVVTPTIGRSEIMQLADVEDVTKGRLQASPVVARWAQLCDDVRAFDADVVVLVARKMPRLFDALELDLGERAICVSDQALPFMQRELNGAKVAVVDDVWNVGTTMKNARRLVSTLGARMVRLFALGAKDAVEAGAEGVHLVSSSSLQDSDYRQLVESAPMFLRAVSKPYDGDFPTLACNIRVPYLDWADCCAWFRSQPHLVVRRTSDDLLLAEGRVRATVSALHKYGWTIKIRLYFDFNCGACTVVPMALAPYLPLSNDYPEESLSGQVFDLLKSTLDANGSLSSHDKRDAFARANTFCDSLMYVTDATQALSGLLQFDTASRFSMADFSMQFGPSAAQGFARLAADMKSRSTDTQLLTWLSKKRSVHYSSGNKLTDNLTVAKQALEQRERFQPAEVVLDALVQGLATAVSAEVASPDKYLVTGPYTEEEIAANPYLRLRIGFTYNELVAFFSPPLLSDQPDDQAVVAFDVGVLLDLFIDSGAIVPTIALAGDPCTRIYRKGESNPKWTRRQIA